MRSGKTEIVKLLASRFVVHESGLGHESGIKSIFAGLGLGLGLGKICNQDQVHFQFSLCIFAKIAVLCLGRVTLWPTRIVRYTQPKISVTYLITRIWHVPAKHANRMDARAHSSSLITLLT